MERFLKFRENLGQILLDEAVFLLILKNSLFFFDTKTIGSKAILENKDGRAKVTWHKLF